MSGSQLFRFLIGLRTRGNLDCANFSEFPSFVLGREAIVVENQCLNLLKSNEPLARSPAVAQSVG